MKLNEIPSRKQILYLGDSGTGKTGSLFSLVEAGYRLWIIDMENGVQILANLIKEKCPNRLNQVEVEQFSENYTITKMGPKVRGSANALVKAGAQIDKWTKEVEWTDKDILVIDSLTGLGKAALEAAKAQNPSAKDYRLHVGNAQRLVEPFIDTLTSADAPFSLIAITHSRYKDIIGVDGRITGSANFPSCVGQSLPERLPQAFNDVYATKLTGSGAVVKREIVSVSTIVSGLKTSSPTKVEKAYPLETGLAQIFEQLTT